MVGGHSVDGHCRAIRGTVVHGAELAEDQVVFIGLRRHGGIEGHLRIVTVPPGTDPYIHGQRGKGPTGLQIHSDVLLALLQPLRPGDAQGQVPVRGEVGALAPVGAPWETVPPLEPAA